MLEIDDFQPVNIDDKKIFDKFYRKYPPVHSDNVFTTIISWMEYSNYHYTVFEENLILYTDINDIIRFRPPVGPRKKQVYEQILKLAKKQNSDYPFGVIDTDTKNWLNENFPSIKFEEHRDFFDYIYLASDLANLGGSGYSKIRNRLNKFKKNFSYDLEDITEVNESEIRNFLRRWCLWKDCESDPILKHERNAIIFSMEHFFELNLSGITIRINGEIESIAVYEKMNPDTIIVHYEKGSPDYDGIYKAINQETAKKAEKLVKYINREPDMGISGLRKAKLSYRPHHMIEVFHVSQDNLRYF